MAQVDYASPDVGRAKAPRFMGTLAFTALACTWVGIRVSQEAAQSARLLQDYDQFVLGLTTTVSIHCSGIVLVRWPRYCRQKDDPFKAFVVLALTLLALAGAARPIWTMLTYRYA